MNERGSATIWILGLCAMILFLGGISLDLWRAFSERRELAAMADAAAIAGASGIDEAHWRASGEARLDPAAAQALSDRALAAHPGAGDVAGRRVAVSPNGSAVTVVLTREVDFTLLRLFLAGAEPFTVRVEAMARPLRAP